MIRDGGPRVDSLDHLVLTVTDMDRTVAFYRDVLGMTVERFQPADGGAARLALRFGTQKINLHDVAGPFQPHARAPQPGSADLCLLSRASLDDWQTALAGHGVAVEAGPVARTGATGPLRSLYVRDPDGNLIEIANAVG